MKVFNCDPQWPICLYDFTYKNKIPQFLCFRASQDPPFIIEDYFSIENSSHISPAKSKKSSMAKSSMSKKSTAECYSGTTEGLLMERGYHMCSSNPCFTRHFKVLFDHCDNDLFCNMNLQFRINDDIKSRKSLDNFIE